LNDNALPNFPDVVHDAPCTTPAFPFPDKSATADPDPSSNAYAATRVADGGGGAAPVVADATFEYGPT
jgi:hypothetical protein